jgi:hypothetical protein
MARYRQSNGTIVNFKPSPDAVPIDEGVSSRKAVNTSSSSSFSKFISDAISTLGGSARSGADQPASLKYPLESYGYAAEVIFKPLKPESIIDDLSQIINSASSKVTNSGDATSQGFQDPYADPIIKESLRKKSQSGNYSIDRNGNPIATSSGDPRRVNVDPQTFKRKTSEDLKQFEGKQSSNVNIKARGDRQLRLQQIGKEVRLYLPQAIQITDGVQVGPIDLGTAGAAVEAGIASGTSDALSLAGQALAGADIVSLIDVFKNPSLQSTAGAFAVQRAARAVGAQGPAGAIARGTRVAVNPNTRSLFRAVNLREFSFTFKMIATSAREAEEIKKIIAFFRKELYPEEIEVGIDGFSGSLAYRMPNLFGIEFRYNSNQQIATKIKPSYLRNFTASYNPSGMGMHEDGNFLETDITMSFVEDTTLSRQDINNGY